MTDQEHLYVPSGTGSMRGHGHFCAFSHCRTIGALSKCAEFTVAVRRFIDQMPLIFSSSPTEPFRPSGMPIVKATLATTIHVAECIMSLDLVPLITHFFVIRMSY